MAVIGKLRRLGLTLSQKHDSRWTPSLALSAWVLTEQGTEPEIIAERIGHGITAKDVRIKIWNMKQQRLKRATAARAKRAERRAVPAVQRPVLRLVEPAKPLRVRLWDLGAGQCHWPLGDDYDPPEWFCGAPAEIGIDGRAMAYCSPHCAIAYRPAGRIHA